MTRTCAHLTATATVVMTTAQTDGIVSDAVAAIIICRPILPSEVNETRTDNLASYSNAAHGLRLRWQLISLSRRSRDGCVIGPNGEASSGTGYNEVDYHLYFIIRTC